MERLDGKRVLLGVTGSIAAYKACELVRELRRTGAEVQVASTRAASAFVTPLTFEALSGRRVLGDVLEVDQGKIPHVEEAYKADLAVVAPASADCLAKMTHGLADEALFATLLAYRGPLLVAPAMETEMWAHPATTHNVVILKERGVSFVGPVQGPLASGRSGSGRLAPIPRILEACLQQLVKQDLAGKRVLVTAGPTCEDLDPVRFLSNRSSGRMGVAIARAAAHRGAEVTLVHGPLKDELPELDNLTPQPVRSAQAMFDACTAQTFDVAVLAAAVADYAPADVAEQKLKKGDGGLSLELARTPDILAHLGRDRGGIQVLVGFAAETERVLENARRKLDNKGADLICANNVSESGSGFLSRSNRITLVSRRGETDLGMLTKDVAADRIVSQIVKMLGKDDNGQGRG